MAIATRKSGVFSGASAKRGNRMVRPEGLSEEALEKARRVVGSVGRVLVFLAALCLAYFAGQWLWRHVKSSPAFAISHVEIAGSEHLSRKDIMQAATINFGDNIFASELEEIEEKLERHPWIAEARAERRLPDRVILELREHDAAAVLSLGTLYLVAGDGTVFKQLAPGDPVDLPVITGVDKERFASDREFRASLLLGILGLFEDYREAGLWRSEQIEEVHVEQNEALRLYVGRDAVQVRLGLPPYRAKILRLRKIFDKLESKNRRAQYVFLDNLRRSDRAVVRLK